MFNRAQHEISQRKRHNITKQGTHINLFAGLIYDPITKTKYIIDKSAKGKSRRLAPLARRNKQARALSVDYEAFEAAVLSWLRGLELEKLTQAPAPTQELEAELDDARRRIATYQQRLEEDPDFEELIAPLKRAVERRNEIEEELRHTAAASASLASTAKEAGSVIREMQSAKGKARKLLRLRMRTHLSKIIDRIDLNTVKHWRWSIGILDIHLKNGEWRREVTHRGVLPEELYTVLLTSGFPMPPEQAKTVKHQISQYVAYGFDARVIKEEDGKVRIVFYPDVPERFAERLREVEEARNRKATKGPKGKSRPKKSAEDRRRAKGVEMA